jgi:putative ABC transport system permease protein
MSEALVIAATGTGIGAALASLALDALRASRGLVIPRLAEVTVDGRAVAIIAAAGIVIAVGSGLMPLLLVRRLGTAIGEVRETAGRPTMRLRAALVVGQTAFAFVLLTVAALAGFNLRSVLAQPLGFETNQIVTMRIAVPAARYRTREDTTRFYTELVDSVRSHPPVQSAGLTLTLPLAGNTGSTLTVQGREDVPMALRPEVGWGWVSPGYFEAMGMPLVAGRHFTADDLTRPTHVTIVNETFARLHFPRDTPIGQRVYFGGYGPGGPPEWHEIVGVVGDVRHRRLDAAPDARAYDLFGQHWSRTVSLAVRTSANPLETAAMVRARVAERDPALAVFAVQTTADLVSQAVATRRLLLSIVTIFAAAGLLVAGVGLYATLSYLVAQRTREIGVRLALGATNAQIQRIVLGRGITIAAGGIGLGLSGVIGMRRLIESAGMGLTAFQAPALGAATLVLIVAAAGACLIPAAKATRIDPVDALRNQ